MVKTLVVYSSSASKTFRIAVTTDTLADTCQGNTSAFDIAGFAMSYPLDFNLRRVAKLRQVTIKTARDWRDSENRKWFQALEELSELRRRTGRDIIRTEPVGFFESLADIENDIPDIQEAPETHPSPIEVEAVASPYL